MVSIFDSKHTEEPAIRTLAYSEMGLEVCNSANMPQPHPIPQTDEQLIGQAGRLAGKPQ